LRYPTSDAAQNGWKAQVRGDDIGHARARLQAELDKLVAARQAALE
jgi:hypothetical protein